MKDFIMRSLRAVFDFFVTKPIQGAVEVAEGVAAIVPELLQAAGSAIASQLSWSVRIKLAQGIDKVRTGTGKMLPAACAVLVVWFLTPAWPLLLYLFALFLVLDLPTTPVASCDDDVARATG